MRPPLMWLRCNGSSSRSNCRSACRGNSCRCNGSIAVAWGPGDPGHGVQDVARGSESGFLGVLGGSAKSEETWGFMGGGSRVWSKGVEGGSCGHPPPAAYITSAGRCLCSTIAVFGFAVLLQDLHLQYLHKHLQYLQPLQCSLIFVWHCCSCNAVWSSAKETPGIAAVK